MRTSIYKTSYFNSDGRVENDDYPSNVLRFLYILFNPKMTHISSIKRGVYLLPQKYVINILLFVQHGNIPTV